MSKMMGPCRLNEGELVELAGHLASVAPESALVFLNGPLGAGKTTLVRAFLRALGVTGPVRSPTYTLIEPYEIEPPRASPTPTRVLHLDLYRLGGADELEYLGLREDLERALVLVEWPECAEGALPEPDLQIALGYGGEGAMEDPAAGGRLMTLMPGSARGAEWLRAGSVSEFVENHLVNQST